MGVNARALAEGVSLGRSADRLEQFYVQLISMVAASHNYKSRLASLNGIGGIAMEWSGRKVLVTGGLVHL
jgi:hypothetical protein